MDEPMKLAIPESCMKGHRFYRESGTETGCPYCLYKRWTELDVHVANIKRMLRELAV